LQPPWQSVNPNKIDICSVSRPFSGHVVADGLSVVKRSLVAQMSFSVRMLHFSSLLHIYYGK
jgi:hypothetical protein